MSHGIDTNTVISSRVRLARNFEGFPFPFKAGHEKRYEIIERVRKTIFANQTEERKFNYIEMGQIDPIYKQALVEKHLISLDLFSSEKPCGLVFSQDEKIGIMVNEEDHLRIQSIMSGLELEAALKGCMEVEQSLEREYKFAFHPRYGYLTTCPTNIGTGMRASVMLHLPALTLTGAIKDVVQACNRIGITVRGLYGENTEALGEMYQISNQKTLGISEEGILHHVNQVVLQIIEHEKNLRNEIYTNNRIRFEDKVMRAYGILKHAKILTSDESLKLLSDVRWGADIGLIPELEREKLDFLLTAIQPGFMQKEAGRAIAPEERDIHRALMIQAVLDSKHNA